MRASNKEPLGLLVWTSNCAVPSSAQYKECNYDKGLSQKCKTFEQCFWYEKQKEWTFLDPKENLKSPLMFLCHPDM
uniref:Putative secreted protein n=1 Tax=Ixodes ricinus TaxID=34613 RepID=A0A6B0UBC5_IXORI